MKVKTITYARVKNLGNYENERLEMIAELEQGESISDAINKIRIYTNDKLGIELPSEEIKDTDDRLLKKEEDSTSAAEACPCSNCTDGIPRPDYGIGKEVTQ